MALAVHEGSIFGAPSRTPEVHQFLAQPLLTRFVIPVLDG